MIPDRKSNLSSVVLRVKREGVQVGDDTQSRPSLIGVGILTSDLVTGKGRPYRVL